MKMIEDNGIMFSVITVCFNVKEKLEYTVNSILNQSGNNYELIIVDGASTDGTYEFLKNYSVRENVKIVSEKDNGLYDAMNKGISLSKGRFIIFMNAGDIFDKSDVLKNLSNICIDKDCIYYGTSKAVYPGGKVRSNRIFRRTHKKLLYDVFDGKMPNHQAIIAGRSTFADNLFDLKYKIGADFKWFAKCVRKKISVVDIPVCVARFEVGGTSSRPTTCLEMLREHEQIVREQFGLRYRIYWMFGYLTMKSTKRMIKEKDKYFSFFFILEQWLSNKQNGLRVEEYIKKSGYKDVAIYGMGVLGNLIYNELKNTDINVLYGIDKAADNMYFDVPVIKDIKNGQKVDAIIVTAVNEYPDIEKKLKKYVHETEIISLESIIYNTAEQN